MAFPANAPAQWARVYVRGYFTDLGKEVRGEGQVGVAGRLDFMLTPDSVAHKASASSWTQTIDTSGRFGTPVDPTTGQATYLVPVGDDPKVSPLGFTTRIYDPVRGTYDVLISKDTPILNRPTGYGPTGTDPDPLHGERVFELGNIAVDPLTGGYYARLPGPPGPSEPHALAHAPGSSQDLSAYYLPLAQKGAVNGLASLGVDGKLAPGQIPVQSLTSVQVVSSQAQMLALTAEPGDVAVRTDLPGTFILRLSPASTLANWTQLPTPTDAVLSVNGETGAVSLTAQEVGGLPTSSRGVANGVASLDAGAKLPLAQLVGHAHSLADLPLSGLDARFDQYYARGTVRRGRKTGNGAAVTTGNTAPTKLIQLDIPGVIGRSYRCVGACPVYSTTGAGNAGLQINYTTDGSTPSGASPRLCYSITATPSGQVGVEAVTEDNFIAGTTGTIKVLLSLFAATAGTFVPQGSTDWAIRFRVEDVGLDPGATGATTF